VNFISKISNHHVARINTLLRRYSLVNVPAQSKFYSCCQRAAA